MEKHEKESKDHKENKYKKELKDKKGNKEVIDNVEEVVDSECLKIKDSLLLTRDSVKQYEYFYEKDGTSRKVDKPSRSPMYEESFSKMCSYNNYLFVFSNRHLRVVFMPKMKEVTSYSLDKEGTTIIAKATSVSKPYVTLLTSVNSLGIL